MNETVLQGAAWNLDYPLVHLKENVGRTSATSVKTCCNITFTHFDHYIHLPDDYSSKMSLWYYFVKVPTVTPTSEIFGFVAQF